MCVYDPSVWAVLCELFLKIYSASLLTLNFSVALLPKGHNDGRGLGTGSDESDDEEEDKEGDECAAGPVTFAQHSMAVLVQIGLDDDKLELVALSPSRRSDDLPALDTGTVRVVPNLGLDREACGEPDIQTETSPVAQWRATYHALFEKVILGYSKNNNK